MLERRYKEPPNVKEIEERGENSPNISILLLKPEASLLDINEKNKLNSLLESYFNLNGEPVCIFPVLIDKESAKKIWQKDISKYLWADCYYEHMASTACVAIVLQGSNSAHFLKNVIRSEMKESIARMNDELGLKFCPDIVHGSDPSCGMFELKTIVDIFNNKN